MLPHCIEPWHAVVSLDAFPSVHFQALVWLYIFNLVSFTYNRNRHKPPAIGWWITIPFSSALNTRLHLSFHHPQQNFPDPKPLHTLHFHLKLLALPF